MPRKSRIYIPDQPQHVVVRGHNRDPVFACPDDFRFMYQCVRAASKQNSLSIHAWVFMHNHLHLLVTPANKDSLPRSMQSIGRRYCQYFNKSYHRSGSLWEGRYKAGLVDTERYLLACYRYIELNPLRAGIVSRPEDYLYSSYHANALGKEDNMVSPHEVYLDFIGLDADHDGGRSLYLDLCREAIEPKLLTDIRRGTDKGLGIGREDFLLKVARLMP